MMARRKLTALLITGVTAVGLAGPASPASATPPYGKLCETSQLYVDYYLDRYIASTTQSDSAYWLQAYRTEKAWFNTYCNF
ncbi:hypothetical protein PAI11_20230 [Patulibacter medicamentivorans]|uniref:Secreted protein n=2 Tax=Patulibacter medicamentivorans TaxID=1097667 RepID=H0E5D2_9ACTN|nr:hypothetical protein PAI11_20230 [Patulibacter medicamentivorans]